MQGTIDLVRFDSELARREKKKVQTSVGNVREVRCLVFKMLREAVRNGYGADVIRLVGLTRYIRGNFKKKDQ